MSPPKLTREMCQAAVDALAKYGNQIEAAEALDLSRSAFQHRIRRAPKFFGADEPERPYSIPLLPSSEMPIDELLARRRAEATRSIAAAEARRLIQVQIKTPGPIGLAVFGDIHIDDPGCDFPLLERHLDMCAPRQNYLFASCVGDFTNNWTGRLGRLYASQNTTVRNSWQLVEWFARRLDWLFMIRGNHDCWSGDNDPLDWILQDVSGVDEKHGVRLSLNHPGGVSTRLHGRHDFKGHSQYNGLHGLVKETLFGDRDHIIIAGHRHFGADAGEVMPDGVCAQLVRVSGYKVVDDYAVAGGFKKKPIHPTAWIIIDPARPETARDRAWCAPSFEEGVEYLDWKRARYDGTARVVVKTPSPGA